MYLDCDVRFDMQLREQNGRERETPKTQPAEKKNTLTTRKRQLKYKHKGGNNKQS